MLAFVLALVGLKLVMGARLDLIRDEAYYALWALHPLQAGYYDHPPAVVWFIKAGRALVGDFELGARLVAIVSVGIVSLAIHRTAMALLGDHRVAALSVYWFNLTPGGMLGLFVITPDAPSMLFWALALWAAAELQAARDGRWWLAFGLFAGLGLASKYTGLFLGAGIALWLLAHRENRRWFASAYLYAGGALALAIFAPVIAWNLDNGLSSFAFQFGRAGAVDLSLRDLLHLPEFVAAQAGLLLPWLFALVVAGLAIFPTSANWRGDARLGLLIWTGVPALAYFLFHGLHATVQGNWPWPLYAQLSVLGAQMALAWKPGGRWLTLVQRQALIWQAPVGVAVGALIFAQASTQFVRLPFLDQTRVAHGWPAVARDVDALVAETGIETILVDDYGLVGWLSVYGAKMDADYRVLPLGEFHRYGFIDLPVSDAALQWPVLLALPAGISAGGVDAPARHPEPLMRLGETATFVARIVRQGADATPAGAIDIYRLERPRMPVFGSD
ncbi:MULTISPECIES: glycosyltransferase family 39 protein [unclassified Roseitalea]|uniref:glycosyltransferase family 39 protein n=1 Tax=unclassified Roseitalea TaxID=2639107 RepID=UPI00273FED31|nr:MULTISPECIES: glycosyltransferase family 39 protein [unclassified Roseitalea]